MKCPARAAHALPYLNESGLPVSSASDDAISSRVVFLHQVSQREFADPSRYQELYPKAILQEQALDLLDFKQINKLRNEGDTLGYFSAIQRVYATIGTAAFDSTYIEYLKTLEQYLIAIQKHVKVDLVDWQSELANTEIDQVERDRKLKDTLVGWSIPIAISMAAYLGIFLTTHSIVPSTPSLISGGVATTAIERGIAIFRAHRPIPTAPLSRLASGTIDLPPFVIPK